MADNEDNVEKQIDTQDGEKNTSGDEELTAEERESRDHTHMLLALIFVLLLLYCIQLGWMYKYEAGSTTFGIIIIMSCIVFCISLCLLASSNPRTVRFGFIGVCIATFINMIVLPLYARITSVHSNYEKLLLTYTSTKIVVYMNLCLIGLIPLGIAASIYKEIGLKNN